MTEQEAHRPGTGPTRTDVAVSWIGWHLGELTAVGVPLALALSVSVWFVALAVLAGTGWAMHELHLARQRRALRAASERRQLAATGEHSDQKSQAAPHGGDDHSGSGEASA